MSTPIGQSLITADGINALTQAQLSGGQIRPKFFRFSETEMTLDPMLGAEDITAWYTHDISLYRRIDGDTVEFVCDVPPTEATHYTRTVGLYLEDGTLYAVAKPPFAFPPMLRQTFKIQITYANAGQLMDFQYIPHQETEQDLALLDTILTQGEITMKEMARARHITHIQGVPVQWI